MKHHIEKQMVNIVVANLYHLQGISKHNKFVFKQHIYTNNK